MATKIKRFLSWASLAVVLAVTVCGISYYVSLRVSHALSQATKSLSLDDWRAWAVFITLSLPVVAGASFFLGRREARLLSDGMRMGVNEVSKAADEVTTLKGKLADRVRQAPVTVQIAAGALPSPPVQHRQLEGGTETIDL